MTERNSNDGGDSQEGAASDGGDGQTRRTFLGAAAAATGGLLVGATGDVSAETGREIIDDGKGRRYADGDYGAATVVDGAFGAFDAETWNEETRVSVSRYSDGIGVSFHLSPLTFNVELTPEESAALRKELRYAEKQVVPRREDNASN